jgi:hypothetical protein
MILLFLVVLLPIDATLLRNDHIRMTELRDKVIEIDAKITDETTDEEMEQIYVEQNDALTSLKEFVFSNIVINELEENGNKGIIFGTGEIPLKNQYRWSALKAWHKAEEMMTDDSNPYGNIYGMAGDHCRPLAIANGWRWSSQEYIDCMTSEIAKYPASENLVDKITAYLPSPDLYYRNYASPIWAPTLTGFVLLLTFILVVVIFIRLIIWIVLRLSLLFV